MTYTDRVAGSPDEYVQRCRPTDFASPGRHDQTPIVDVILDRSDHTDVAHVVVNGEVVVRDRTVTTVDEAENRTAFDDAITAIGRPDEVVRRGPELSHLASVELDSVYEPLYRVPVEPASVYNVRVPRL